MKVNPKNIKLHFIPYLLIVTVLIAISSTLQFILHQFIKIPWYDFDSIFTFIIPAITVLITTYKLLHKKLDEIQFSDWNS